MVRKRNSASNGTLLKTPWWVWFVLAVLAFFGFRLLMGIKSGGGSGEAVGRGILIGVSLVGQVIAPLALGLLGFLALIRQRQQPRTQPQPYEYQATSPRDISIVDDRDLYSEWKAVSATAPERPPIDTSRWTLELLKALEWKRLEQLCAVYFRTLKFRVEEAPPGADGGVDLRLYAGSDPRPGVLVQCKAWNSFKVGVKEIREHFGVMSAEMVGEGIYVTTSTFTNEAIQFARGKNIALIDGQDLLIKILNLPVEDQDHILRLVTAGDFTTPSCPSCGTKMVHRTSKGTGKAFWGCPTFPRCRTTLQLGAAGTNSRS